MKPDQFLMCENETYFFDALKLGKIFFENQSICIPSMKISFIE
jgi:hypothetical protein